MRVHSSPIITSRLQLRAWHRGLTAFLWLAVLLAAIHFAHQVIVPAENSLTQGFAAYYTASRLLLSGQFDARVYDNAWFEAQARAAMNGEASDIFNVNPPSTAWMMVGLAALSPHTARIAWTLGNLALLMAALALLGGELGLGGVGLGLLALIALGFTPISENFRLGQAYILLLFLYTLALRGFLRGEDGLLGLSLALLLALKSAGAPLLLLLLLWRRWRALGIALAGAALIVVGSLPWIGLDTWRAYLLALPDIGRGPWATSIFYQTTNSLWQHLFRYDPQWNPGAVVDLPALAAVLTLLSIGVALAVTLRYTRQDKPPDLVFAAFVVLTVLLAPVGEQHHHTVLLLPLAVVLARTGQASHSRPTIGQWLEAALAAGALILLAKYIDLRHAETAGWGALLAYPRVYGTWLLWAGLMLRLKIENRERVDRQPVSSIPRPPSSVLLGLFAVALALRLALILAFRFDGLYGQDAFEYYTYGRALWEARGRVPLPGPMYWPLGYPYAMLLGFLVTGVRPVGAQLISLLAGSAAAPLTALLACDVLLRFGAKRDNAWRAALVAGVLMAACGQLVQSSIVVMSDAAGVFWAVLSAWALVRAQGTRRPAWLVLSACALAAATMTRWINGLLLLPWAGYWLVDVRQRPQTTEGGRRISPCPLSSVVRPLAVALIAAGLAFAPQAVQSAADPSSSLGHIWLQGWNPANALQRSFVNLEGVFNYPWPVALFYARPAFHPFFLSPIFTPALVIGLGIVGMALVKRGGIAGAAPLLIGWPLAQYMFLAGIPYQNSRYALALVPPLIVLTGIGANALWTVARSRWGRAVLLAAGAIGVAGMLFWGWRTTLASPIQLKQADLETARWVQRQVPADARVLAFGLTATLRFYTPLEAREFFNETPETLAALLADGRPTYLVLNVGNVETQWQGRSPQINLHWLRDGPGLEEIGERNDYTLYRILQ
jgi:4-amino-4-deoxy-L-arabinose transferase-like glycosyltransferase